MEGKRFFRRSINGRLYGTSDEGGLTIEQEVATSSGGLDPWFVRVEGDFFLRMEDAAWDIEDCSFDLDGALHFSARVKKGVADFVGGDFFLGDDLHQFGREEGGGLELLVVARNGEVAQITPDG